MAEMSTQLPLISKAYSSIQAVLISLLKNKKAPVLSYRSFDINFSMLNHFERLLLQEIFQIIQILLI